MTTQFIVTFRRFFAGVETVGHVPAFYSTLSGQSHFLHFAEGELNRVVLSDIDSGKTAGHYTDGGQIVAWKKEDAE